MYRGVRSEPASAWSATACAGNERIRQDHGKRVVGIDRAAQRHLHHVDKLAPPERLSENKPSRLAKPLAHSLVVGEVPRHVENLDARSFRRHLGRQRKAVDPGHHHVGHEQVDVVWVGLDNVERFRTATGDQRQPTLVL